MKMEPLIARRPRAVSFDDWTQLCSVHILCDDRDEDDDVFDKDKAGNGTVGAKNGNVSSMSNSRGDAELTMPSLSVGSLLSTQKLQADHELHSFPAPNEDMDDEDDVLEKQDAGESPSKDSTAVAGVSSGNSCSNGLHTSKTDEDHHVSGRQHPRSLAYLYISYLLCRWGDRMWEFAVGLFMIEIWKKSLLLTSLYGLVETAAIVLFGVRLGEWVDRFPRLRVIQASLALQNLCVFSATLAILLLLIRPYHKDGRGLIVFICLVAVVNIFGGISALASLATKISLERDWVIILAADQPSGQLTKMNSTMRRLDLACTLLAAVFVGFIMSAMSVVASAIGMATWNITCVGIEYWLLLSVYNGTPRLHEEKASYHLVSEMDIQKLVAQNSDVLFKEDKAPCKQSPCPNNLNSFQLSLALLNNHGTFLWHKVRTLSVFDGWKVYLRQESMLAGIAFSLLSVSVLSFGTLMTATLKWRGCPAYILGIARGCAAFIGICATLFYPYLHARMQALKAGMLAIMLQWFFLILCVVSIWLKNLDISTLVLMTGAATARAGLWMFDLSVTQLMQDSVPEVERGVVAGVQNCMQSFCQLLAFVAGMIVHRPQDFGRLILMSFGSVTMAAFVYAVQVYKGCINREELPASFMKDSP